MNFKLIRLLESGSNRRWLPWLKREKSEKRKGHVFGLKGASNITGQINRYVDPQMEHPCKGTEKQKMQKCPTQLTSSPICFSQSVSSLAQSCLTLCEPMDCSTPGLSVHHQIPEFTQIHVHQVGDAIQPSCSLSSSSPPTFNLSQHQGLFK